MLARGRLFRADDRQLAQGLLGQACYDARLDTHRICPEAKRQRLLVKVRPRRPAGTFLFAGPGGILLACGTGY